MKQINEIFSKILLLGSIVVLTVLFLELNFYILLKNGFSINSFSLKLQTKIIIKKDNPFEIPNSLSKMQSYPIDYADDDSSWLKSREEGFKSLDGLSIPIPNVVYIGSLLDTRTKNKIYEYRALIDSVGRRITHKIDNKKYNKHFLLFGCSYTFGQGVDDRYTIPWLLQQKSNDWEFYNFAYNGYGANSILARMQYEKQNYYAGVGQSKGLSAYIFLYDHLDRFIGTLDDSGLESWRLSLANLEEYSPFKFIWKGSFQSNRFWKNKIYAFLNETNSAKFFSIHFPIMFEGDIARFVRAIKAIETSYLTQFSEANHFYFIIYPQTIGGIESRHEILLKYLNQYKISYIDYSGVDIRTLAPVQMLYPDLHPKPHANQVFADMLYQDLPLLH